MNSNINIATVEAALGCLVAGDQMASFTKPESRQLLAAIGASIAVPQDVQAIGLIALHLLVQASRADAITERALRVVASGSRK